MVQEFLLIKSSKLNITQELVVTLCEVQKKKYMLRSGCILRCGTSATSSRIAALLTCMLGYLSHTCRRLESYELSGQEQVHVGRSLALPMNNSTLISHGCCSELSPVILCDISRAFKQRLKSDSPIRLAVSVIGSFSIFNPSTLQDQEGCSSLVWDN